MIYFHSTGDVHNNLIEETVLINAFPGNPTEIDQYPNVPPNLVQLALWFMSAGYVRHPILTLAPQNCAMARC